MSREPIQQLYFVSESEHKFNDYQFLLGRYADLRWFDLSVEEPMTRELGILIRRKVALVKPRLPYLPFLVEQTNLTIKAWRDLPGNLTSAFIEGVGLEGICKMLGAFEDRTAVVITDLAFHSSNGHVSVFRGQLSGRIAEKPHNSPVYGWDAIFIPDGYDRTFAEMPLEQRNSLSTRRLAVSELIKAELQEEEADVLLQNRIKMRQLITRYFSTHEMETLIFDLGIDKGELPPGIKTERAQEIILYCERHDLIPRLLDLCREQRPNAEWPDTL